LVPEFMDRLLVVIIGGLDGDVNMYMVNQVCSFRRFARKGL